MTAFISKIKSLFHWRCRIETVLLFTGPLRLYKQNSGIVFLPVKVCTKCGKLHDIDLNQKWYVDDMSNISYFESNMADTYLKMNETTKLKQPTLSDKAIAELKPYYIYDALYLDPRAKPIPESEDFLTVTHDIYDI